MKNFIIKILNYLSTIGQNFTSKLSKRMYDENGEKKVQPHTIKRLAAIFGASLAISYIVVVSTDSNRIYRDGLEDFKEEKKEKFEITEVNVESETKIIDPLGNLKNEDIEFGLTIEKCEKLKNKVMQGLRLSILEKADIEDCISQGLLTLDEAQIKALKTLLNNPDLSEEAKSFLKKAIAGEDVDKNILNALTGMDEKKKKAALMLLDPNVSQAQKDLIEDFLENGANADVVDLLVSDDPEKKKLGEKIAQAIKDGNNKLANALRKQAKGEQLTDEEYNTVKDQVVSTKGLPKAKILKDLKDAINKRKKVIAKKKQEIEEVRDRLVKGGVFEKIKKGIPLTKEEQDLFDKFNELNKELNELEELQKRDMKLYSELAEAFRLELEAAGIETKDLSEQISMFKKTAAVKKGSPPKKIIKDSTGRIIPESEYKLIQLYKKKLAQSAESDFDRNLKRNISAKSFLKDDKIRGDNLVVFTAESNKGFSLPLDLRIPVELEGELVASSADPANKRCILRILDNVYHPETNKLLLAKGAKAIGLTQSFDIETKLMNVTVQKVIYGSKTYDISFTVADTRGRTGIPGGVMDTRGKKITAAVLAEFAAGVVDFFATFSQQQQIQNGVLNIQQALTGSALQGTGAGLQKISEGLVQDLQQAPSIYYAPKGMKLVLLPN